MRLFIVQAQQSDPWYSPAFYGVFDDLDKAKQYAEDGEVSEWDRKNGVTYTFRWEARQHDLYLIDATEEDYIHDTGIFISTAVLNPSWKKGE